MILTKKLQKLKENYERCFTNIGLGKSFINMKPNLKNMREKNNWFYFVQLKSLSTIKIIFT